MGCNTNVMLVAHLCIMIFVLGAARLPSLAVKCNYITVVGILEFSFGLLTLSNTGLSKKMDGIWNRYNLKTTGRIYTFGVLKYSEKFKVLDLL